MGTMDNSALEERTSVLEPEGWQHTIYIKPDDADEYTAITLPVGRWDYGAIVSAIVKSRYSDDDAMAIMLNMQGLMSNCVELADTKAAEYQEEYMALERWRQYAKQEGKYFVDKYNYLP